MGTCGLEPFASMLQSLLPNQPAEYIWLTITGLFFVIFALVRRGSPQVNWRRRLIAGLAKGLAFLGLAVLVLILLTGNYASFSTVYGSFTTKGSLSNQAYESWHSLYRDTLIQHELGVTQYVSETRLQTIEPDQPNQTVRYIDVTVEEPLGLNSITAFNGQATVNLVDPKHQEDSFNAFSVTAAYEYEISNPSEHNTRAVYSFPIDMTTRIYRDIHILVNGKELNGWKTGYNSLEWEQPMKPGQVDKVEIQYTTWGMDMYAYVVDTAREVRNFQFSLAFETDNH